MDQHLPAQVSYSLRRALGRGPRNETSLHEYEADRARTQHLTVLIKQNRYSEFVEYWELTRGKRLNWVAGYARAVVKLGEPEKLLNLLDESQVIRLSENVRMSWFTALISVGRFADAARFARDLLASGKHGTPFVWRVFGDCYLLDDKQLMMNCAGLLARSGDLSPRMGLYIRNVILSHIGEDALSAPELHGLPKVEQTELDFFRSNLALFRGDYVAQLTAFNAGLAQYGLPPVASIDPAKPLTVTNLEATPPGDDAVPDGPRVSVFVSMFNASRTIEAVLRSLSAQTYRNIEIIVADDCSTDASLTIAERHAHQDARVRVIKMESNGGTYRARNRGLTMATGELFVCNDADDWAHPERIERLVAPLVGDKSLIASRAQLVRLGSRGLKPKRKGYVHGDASSLCFWRKPATDRIGYLDTSTRFGADTEFANRLELAFGIEKIASVTKPLLFADWSQSSLSGSLGTGITDGGTFAPGRRKYRAAYLQRHANGEIYREFS